MTARWDIFCKIVDNFGDAGVSWRLARQLAHDHALAVTLWIDEPAALARMAPTVDAGRDMQRADGIEIRRWSEPFADAAPADVVVEAFGGPLPPNYLAAMACAVPAPAWFVLEYLSAEAWIDASHALASPHPRLPLVRRFWFPGFTPASGGLLRERGLAEARDAFRRDDDAQRALWSSLAVPAPVPGERRVSLFCYPNPALPALFDAWADGDEAVVCVVPEGVAAGALDAWTAGNVPHRGHSFRRGRLALHAIPFLPQDGYDRLLWACDINFVRGEDSFVRAQWAARPFVWNIYPQAERAHERKLAAFVERISEGEAPAVVAAFAGFHRAWNGIGGAAPMPDAWLDFATACPHIDHWMGTWSERLAALPDLASGLVRAAADRV